MTINVGELLHAVLGSKMGRDIIADTSRQNDDGDDDDESGNVVYCSSFNKF